MPDIDQKKIEKWMRDNPSLELSLWLETEKHNLKNTSLYCKSCRTFKSKIEKIKFYNNAWVEGSRNYKISNVKDHCNSKPHKLSMEMYKASVLGQITSKNIENIEKVGVFFLLKTIVNTRHKM